MAGDPDRRQQAHTLPDRVHPHKRQVQNHSRPELLVGPAVGPHPLLRRLGREILMRHRRLRLREGTMRRRRRHPARDPGRVHA